MSDSERPSRVISGAPAGAQRWEAPQVDTAQKRAGRPVGLMTMARLEEMERQAREEGFRSGHAEGLQAGRKRGETEMRKVAARLEQLLDAMARPLANIDRRVEEELTGLAVAVAREVLRRELQTDPGQVVGIIREAIAALPSAGGEVKVFLHPEDAALVRETLHLEEMERPWRLFEEPSMGRGGARVSTSDSQVDGSLERRLDSIVTAVWGEGREGGGDLPAGNGQDDRREDNAGIS